MTTGFQSSGQDSDRLDSWKAIAAYLGKDVRTAFRWSKDEGMPVYRHAGSKRGAVYAYRSEIDAWIHSDRTARPSVLRNKRFLWAASITVLTVAASLLWLSHPGQQAEAIPAQPVWVLIADFDNHTGEDRFDDTLETALRRELANSSHVRVVAPEWIRDMLALMRRSADTVIDAELGREICLRHGGVRGLLTGRVEKFDTQYLLSLEVVDPADGRTVASTEEIATGDVEVLPALHRLGNWLRADLGEELTRIAPGDERLERVTTPSLRALELYSRGVHAYRLGRLDESEAFLRQAAEEDPGFASAHMFAFWALYQQGRETSEEARASLRRAMELAATTSEQEQLFIEGTYYDFMERDHEKSCRSYKALAGLFPDHYWAAGNATMLCGIRLGDREDYVRFALQAAERRPYFTADAALALIFLEQDFDRARPYVEILRGQLEDGAANVARDPRVAVTVEFFPAEERLAGGLLPEVASELQRIERALGQMDQRLQTLLTMKLLHFHFALGQLQKAEALGREHAWLTVPVWRAYLAGDQAGFQRHLEDLDAKLREKMPDPTGRLKYFLGWNMGPGTLQGAPPLDVLAPLYDPEAAMETVSTGGEPAPLFLSLPGFEAKMQLARGRQLHLQGRLEEAGVELEKGVEWFRDRGSWTTFPYYFLGSELLAVVLAEQEDLQAAYRVLEAAAGRRNMVNSWSAPLHRKIQARLALLARELGRIEEAEALEAELENAFALADPDHPILVQIRVQQNRLPAFE